jgi:hypothetical protein
MPRQSNWPASLALFIEEKRNQKFVWGQNDCCMFSCDWVYILTREDPATLMGLRDTYSTGLGAFRKLKELGGLEMVVERWAETHGWPEVPLARAGRGDLVIYATGRGFALGVCLGRLSAFAGPDGVSFIETAACNTAWHIPTL